VYAYDRAADELVLQAVYGTRLDEAAPLPRMRPGEGLTGSGAGARAGRDRGRRAFRSPLQGLRRLDESASSRCSRYRSSTAPNGSPRDERPHRRAARLARRRGELLETIASQVAQAIENARLYDRSRRRVTELEALARISEALSQSLYETETLAEIVATARGAVHAATCALVLVAPDGLHVAQRDGEADGGDARLLELAARAPTDEKGALAVPLVWKTRTIGALVCLRRGRFTAEEQTCSGRSRTRRRPPSSRDAG
jgi:hypothetical protein